MKGGECYVMAGRNTVDMGKSGQSFVPLSDIAEHIAHILHLGYNCMRPGILSDGNYLWMNGRSYHIVYVHIA